jgi:hypothetical protein
MEGFTRGPYIFFSWRFWGPETNDLTAILRHCDEMAWSPVSLTSSSATKSTEEP